MKIFASFFVFLFLAQPAFSCAWITGTKYDGTRASVSGWSGASMLRRSLKSKMSSDGAKMELRLRDKTDFDSRNDYAVALMYLGRSKEAVEILQNLEKEQPGVYYTAANLGTAHELSGNNIEALRWIQEGIRRNPSSHFGTEWLHVKILQSKIAQNKDRDYFKKNSVLGFRPEQIREDIVIEGSKFTLKEVKRAIEYQLKERLQFVKRADPSVASLLFDYAAIEAADHSLESAKGILEMALEFGYPPDQIKPLVNSYNSKIRLAQVKLYSMIAMLVLGVLGILFFCYKRGWFVLSGKALNSSP